MQYIEQVSINKVFSDYLPEVHCPQDGSVPNVAWGPPIWVVSDLDQYYVIDGKQRLINAQKLNLKQIDIVSIGSKVNEFVDLKKSLHLNAFSMSFWDWAHLFRQKCGSSLSLRNVKDDLWDAYATSYLGDKDKEYADFLSQAEQWIFEEVFKRTLKVEQLLYVDLHDNLHRDAWVRLMLGLKMNHNELKIWMQYVDHICQREVLSLEQLWQQLGVDSILSQNFHERVRYRHIFEELWKRRFPIRYEAEEKIRQLYLNLKAPKDLAIQLPKDLEGDHLILQLKAYSVDQLDELLVWIDEHKDLLNDFFEWI